MVRRSYYIFNVTLNNIQPCLLQPQTAKPLELEALLLLALPSELTLQKLVVLPELGEETDYNQIKHYILICFILIIFISVFIRFNQTSY